MTCDWPFAGKSADDPPVNFDFPILPVLKPRSCLVGDFPAAFAALSTLFRMELFFPLRQMMSVRILHVERRVRNLLQRSELSTGLPAFVIQPFLATLMALFDS